MNQYFEHNASLKTVNSTFTCTVGGFSFTFNTRGGVFSKGGLDNFSSILISRLLEMNISGDVLDLGCGFGAIGIILGKRFPGINLYQSDINPAAVDLAAENARLNGVTSRAVLSDGYENLRFKFDWVILNPPIHAGKAVVYGLFRETKKHLKPGGRFVIVIHKKHGAESALRELQGIFEDAEAVYKKKGLYVVVCGGIM